MKKKLIRVFIITCIAVALGFIGFFTVQIVIVQTTKNYIFNNVEDVPVCDTIMVLGAFVYSDGRATSG